MIGSQGSWRDDDGDDIFIRHGSMLFTQSST